MQWFVVCSLLLGLLCLLVGLNKSRKSQQPPVALQHCSGCGWTTEQVQYCQFEHNRRQVTVPLCFECAIERDAIPSGQLSALAS